MTLFFGSNDFKNDQKMGSEDLYITYMNEVCNSNTPIAIEEPTI